MAKSNQGPKAGSGSGDSGNTQDGANAGNSGGSELDLNDSTPVAGEKQQGTGEKSMAVESGQAKSAASGQPPLGDKTKQKWLDEAYIWNGAIYGPSKYPGDLVEVPADFPDNKGGEEPSPEEWTPRGTSAVKEIEVNDDKETVL